MALEKRFAEVPQQLFTANGTAGGLVTVADACLFRVEQVVLVGSNTQNSIRLEIKGIPSTTEIYVGRLDNDNRDRVDVSAYLVADSAFITAHEQPRPPKGADDVTRAAYQEEPTVAFRNLLVDDCGNSYGDNNPLPVAVDAVNVGDVSVQLTRQDDDPNLGDVHDSVRIGSNDFEVSVIEDAEFTRAALAVTGLNDTIDVPWDDMEVTATNSKKNPTTIVYRNDGVTVRTLTLTYDTSGNNVTRVQKT